MLLYKKIAEEFVSLTQNETNRKAIYLACDYLDENINDETKHIAKEIVRNQTLYSEKLYLIARQYIDLCLTKTTQQRVDDFNAKYGSPA